MKKIVAVLLILVTITGCQTAPEEDLVQTTYALGTVITINLYDQGDEALMKTLIDKVTDIEQKMSSQKETSEVNAITAGAGVEPVIVSEDTFQVIQKALTYSELSDGRFDPTIRPILDLWQIGTDDARVPEAGEIEEALPFVDYSKVVLDEESQAVYLPETGMALDLGGIAKGYVADELVKLLDEYQIERAMINLGGNIYAYGEKASGEPYKIAIQTPYDTRNTYFGFVELRDMTVVTSGPYERFFEEEGSFYHHIFDAKTGYPTSGEVVSVSVITKNSMDADALSTLLFTMSPDEGLALIESMEGTECIYVDKDYGLILSSGLKETFTLTDTQYKILND